MTNGWERSNKMAENHGEASGKFIKLPKDGDKVVGVFCGEPNPREVVWNGEKYIDYNGDSGVKPTMRVSINFYDLEQQAMRIMENGVTWFKDLLKVRDKYGLEGQSYEVERHGTGTNTSYTILPDRKLSDEEQRSIANTELHDLTGSSSQKSDFSSYDRSTGSSIDPHESSAMVARLKALPREHVNGFLKRFNVQKIRDLKASDATVAWEFIEDLEFKHSRASQGETEVDPFA